MAEDDDKKRPSNPWSDVGVFLGATVLVVLFFGLILWGMGL